MRYLKKINIFRLRFRLILKILKWTAYWILTFQMRKQLRFLYNYILIDQSGVFDSAFYLQNNPDVQAAGADPLAHYLRAGAEEGRNPNPLFDTSYYLAQNPDVAAAGENPLVHYLSCGAGEGRNPSPFIDRYIALNPDAAAKSTNPLLQYLSPGMAEDSKSKFIAFLPQGVPVLPDRIEPKQNIVDIIIPVYRGLKETQACIESVFAAKQSTQCEIIVINDKSPEPPLLEYLENAAVRHGFKLLHNEINLGFVRSVNRAMELNPNHDVILLNSDTIVAHDWVDRLVRCAYANPKIGTVTPFSNNATIAGYPRFCKNNLLPDGVTVQSLDAVFKEVNADTFVEIPTAVGFCMYIRRDCLNEIGLFDAETFGKGYGEENDFCMKALRLGWRHVLAADTFVFHAGEVSFLDSSDPKQHHALEIIRRLYPHYIPMIQAFCGYDPAKQYRLAATARLIKEEGNPVILFITHVLGGGIEKHIKDLISLWRERAHVLILRPNIGNKWLLESSSNKYPFDFLFDCEAERDKAVNILKACGLSRVHIHHILGYNAEIQHFTYALNVPYDFTLHDYFTLCPKIQMTGENHQYCGEPDTAGCNACISKAPSSNMQDIESWRSTHAWLINGADRIFAPSADVANRLRRYYPNKNFIVVSHPDSLANTLWSEIRVKPVLGSEPLKILILGTLAPHKGADRVEDAAVLAKKMDLPLEFHVLGQTYRRLKVFPQSSLHVYGSYDDSELLKLISDVDPHVVWFPAVWPETYSYTLSACFATRLPVVAPNLGAFSERLKGRPWSWIVDWDLPIEQLLQFFIHIRQEYFSKNFAPEVNDESLILPKPFYDTEYLTPTKISAKPNLTDLRQPGKISVIAIMPRFTNGQLQACSYIRLISPLTHPSLANTVDFKAVLPREALRYRADVLIVQRDAVSDEDMAYNLLEHCHATGMKAVYESDDDLFHLSPTHLDADHYEHTARAAYIYSAHADRCIVSTAYLRDRMLDINKNISLIQNLLDERIWIKSSEPRSSPLEPSSIIRILYMGTVTHDEDLSIVEEAIRQLLNEYGERLCFDVIGVVPSNKRSKWFNHIQLPAAISNSYPRFVGWLLSQRRWNIGIAPLVDTEFNRCKSYIKYLDYAALGLASVFSETGPYLEVVKQNKTGLICKNTTEEWYAALKKLINDHELRVNIQRTSYRDLISRYTLASRAVSRKTAWVSVFSGVSETAHDKAVLP
ncbi:MAG: glycosyltransferase [Deltaproteobacteria bacterium]|nr:glycosyltransferase [Deltaproteobacteria bacterium]